MTFKSVHESISVWCVDFCSIIEVSFTLTTVPLRSGGDDDEVRVKCFDHDKNAIEFGDLKEGTECSVVVELKRLWFVKRNFGPEWYSIQIKTHKVPEPDHDPYDGYLFQDDE